MLPSSLYSSYYFLSITYYLTFPLFLFFFTIIHPFFQEPENSDSDEDDDALGDSYVQDTSFIKVEKEEEIEEETEPDYRTTL